MLKITLHVDSGADCTLILEGQITARWVAGLRSEYVRTQEAHRRMTLDLKGVTFIDAAGVAFFDELDPGVTLVNCSLFAAEQLKDVMARHERVQA